MFGAGTAGGWNTSRREQEEGEARVVQQQKGRIVGGRIKESVGWCIVEDQ